MLETPDAQTKMFLRAFQAQVHVAFLAPPNRTEIGDAGITFHALVRGHRQI